MTDQRSRERDCIAAAFINRIKADLVLVLALEETVEFDGQCFEPLDEVAPDLLGQQRLVTCIADKKELQPGKIGGEASRFPLL